MAQPIEGLNELPRDAAAMGLSSIEPHILLDMGSDESSRESTEQGGLPLRPYITSRTRHLAKQAIEAMAAGEFGRYELLFRRLFSEHHQSGEGLPALVELFDSPDAVTAVFAAGMVLQIGLLDPGAVSEADHALAEDLLIDALSGPAKSLVCGALVGVRLSPRLVTVILPLLGEQDEYDRFAAAAALGASGIHDPRVRRLLADGLRHKDPVIGFLAATALLKLGLHEKESLGTLTASLRSLHANAQYDVWVKIRAIGSRNEELADFAVTVAGDRLAHPAVRGAAAAALYVLTAHTDTVTAALIDHVRKPGTPWQLISGAIETLAPFQRLGDVVDRMVELLEDPQASMRTAAAIGLQRAGALAASKVELIATCFLKEADLNVIHMLVRALEEIGPPAVNSLVDIISKSDLERTGLALAALKGIGEDAVPALAKIFLETDNQRVQMLVASAFSNMGRRAKAALPAICSVLDTTSYQPVAHSCVLAILNIGEEAEVAIPSLLDWIAHVDSIDDSSARWALLALYLMRSHAIPALKTEIARRNGASRDRLERILSQLAQAGDPRFEYLEGVDITLLADFVATATVLKESGRIARRMVADILNDRGIIPKAGRSSQWAPQRVDRTFEKVSEALAVEVVQSDQHQGTSLTKEGLRVLADAAEYLRLTAARRSLLG